jgi:hypothetical protein
LSSMLRVASLICLKAVTESIGRQATDVPTSRHAGGK